MGLQVPVQGHHRQRLDYLDFVASGAVGGLEFPLGFQRAVNQPRPGDYGASVGYDVANAVGDVDA